MLRMVLRRAGLKTDVKDPFHQIRRTSATHLANVAGEAVVQDHLGHSSAAVMRKSYLDVRLISRRVHAADMLPRPEWRRPEPQTIPLSRGA